MYKGKTYTKLSVLGGLTAVAITFVLVLTCAPATARAFDPSATDQDAWYCSDGWVGYALDNNLIDGHIDSSGKVFDFDPNDLLTRGQAAAILYYYDQSKTADTTDNNVTSSFADMGANEYYSAAVAWASGAGIVTGYEDRDATGNGLGTYSNFGPNDRITREQLATMVARYLRSKGAPVDQASLNAAESLLGWNKVSDYAQQSVAFCAAYGIIEGVDNHNGTYSVDAQGPATRAQMAKVVTVTARDVLPLFTGAAEIKVAAVSLGESHSAAIKTDGSLWTWGYDYYGQLGDVEARDRSTPLKLLDNVASVSLGTDYSAAIKTDGSLWMWGCNYQGRLGDGTTEERQTPVKVMDDVAAVSLGAGHSAAIKTDGSLWMWGNNSNGQLGDGTTENRITPVKVMDNAASASLGYWHTAVIKGDGSLWLWGKNDNGELGDGMTEERHSPVKILDNIASVSLGYHHSAAIKTDGSLWTWGSNMEGQLGDGTRVDRHVPVKVMDGIVAVSLGTADSAAIKTDGSLWTWGWNNHSSLGDGTWNNRCTPGKVMDNASSVSLGLQYSSAIKKDGSLWAWGNNAYGQLGDSTRVGRSTPVRIAF